MKRLSARHFNILFHTHTVSGIVISAVLYIIFFAGAIALYKQELYQWEDPDARIENAEEIDYEELMLRLVATTSPETEIHELRVVLPTLEKPIYTFYLSDEVGGYKTYGYNAKTDKLWDMDAGEISTTGETLYRLHFLDQIPWYIGRYIAGFVSLFFAFAVITGLLIHWRNIRTKFFAFSFKDLRKQFWTNAHTVFGVIGLPFQLMYAITGAFYLLSVFILAPAVFVLFGGDQDKLVTMIYPPEAFHAHEDEAIQAKNIPIQKILDNVHMEYPQCDVSYLEIINPGHDNAVLTIDLVNRTSFNADGLIVADLSTGAYKLHLPPGEKNYQQSLLQGISKIHFASFGGWMLKMIYFLLAMFTCFVIISGVMMWKEARNKPSYTDRQRRFHHRVTMVYLAVCLALYPATALLFSAEQWIPRGTMHVHKVNSIFFLSWLFIAVFCYFLRNERQIFITCLLLGGFSALLVPLSNGWNTGDWLWLSALEHPYVSMVDSSWLLTGIFSLFSVFYTLRRKDV
ncbi:PepSY-associated TM helix domain-containing protein [Sphingobacterium sp. LRF_L2]|uniref:PepSY-associated TM helix domain-containing protein n=1 Tax=Sphingobacterium sp. LRF_L2 TaxID=3369421 RepID=UPI003F62B76C